MHGWVKISPLENTKKNQFQSPPNRIGRNFGNLLVFVSSFYGLLPDKWGFRGPSSTLKRGVIYKNICLCVILIVKPSLDLCKLWSRSSIPWKPWKRLKTLFFASEEVLKKNTHSSKEVLVQVNSFNDTRP